MFDTIYGNNDVYEINEDAWLAYQAYLEEETEKEKSKYFKETC